MLIKILSFFFAERIFDRIPYKQQGKMKMFFLPMSRLVIRAKGI